MYLSDFAELIQKITKTGAIFLFQNATLIIIYIYCILSKTMNNIIFYAIKVTRLLSSCHILRTSIHLGVLLKSLNEKCFSSLFERYKCSLCNYCISVNVQSLRKICLMIFLSWKMFCKLVEPVNYILYKYKQKFYHQLEEKIFCSNT